MDCIVCISGQLTETSGPQLTGGCQNCPIVVWRYYWSVDVSSVDLTTHLQAHDQKRDVYDETRAWKRDLHRYDDHDALRLVEFQEDFCEGKRMKSRDARMLATYL